MFIAHLPAAYLATGLLLDRAGVPARGRLMALGLAAGIAPDLDLLWFYLVDRSRVHHVLPPHLPAFWVAALLLAAALLGALRAGRAAWLALTIVGVNALLHLVLDTTAGGIQWLWPASRQELVLFGVPARFHPWFLNFVLHWTFLLELAVIGFAASRLTGRRGPAGVHA